MTRPLPRPLSQTVPETLPATLLAVGLALSLGACSGIGDVMPFGDASIDGLVVNDGTRPVTESIGALQDAIANNDALRELALVDHRANAASVDLTLRPTTVLLFGNPALGTQLMQANQQAGLDLPQKMLAWEDESGTTRIAYNRADYLRERHALSGVDEVLGTIAGALNTLAGVTAGSELTPPVPSGGGGTDADEGVLALASTRGVDETYAALIEAIDAIGPLNVLAEVDHGANAGSVGMTLRPTRLAIFGNPAAGTPLMQAAQDSAIDLPQKMLVFEREDGTVTIAWNDPAYVAERHGIEGQQERLAMIGGLLDNLAAQAAGSAATGQ